MRKDLKKTPNSILSCITDKEAYDYSFHKISNSLRKITGKVSSRVAYMATSITKQKYSFSSP